MKNFPPFMVSQHPDNANKPFWHSSAYIRDHDEVKECYFAYSKLDASEYKWDWEGKFVDESVFERLISEYPSFFHKYQLGRDKFLTYRLPDFRVDTEFRLGRALMGIISAAGLAKTIGFHSPPISEVILPMTQSSDEIISVHQAFQELLGLSHPLNIKSANMENIKVIPLFEDIEKIISSSQIIKEYLKKYSFLFKTKPKYLRPYLARSDSALNSGLIPSILSIKIALSDYRDFEEKEDIVLAPIVGTGSLPFRGGSTPYGVDGFVKEYAGIKTMLVQSAFQYDFPSEDVLKAVKKIKNVLPKTKSIRIPEKDRKEMISLIKEIETFYRQTVRKIGQTIYSIAVYMPPRRERLRHTGLLKYPRQVAGTKIPRAINFTASLYSIGVPPEFIGTGRAVKYAREKKKLELIEKNYLNLRSDLIKAGRYLNKEVLSILAKKSGAWREIEEDVKLLEKYLGKEFKPDTTQEKAHQIYTKSIYDRFSKGIEMTDLIEEAAVLRRSLG